MIVVTFLAASGAGDELSAHVLGAINHGLTRAEVEEIVNQVAGYASFPMAMHATRLVDAVWLKLDGIEHPPAKETAVPSDDEARHAAALDVMGSLFAGRAAGTAEAARAGIVALLGGVGEMALSRVEELAVHVPGALNHGCSRAEVEEIMVQLTAYGGFPRAVRVVEGIRPARAAFQLIDERAARG